MKTCDSGITIVKEKNSKLNSADIKENANAIDNPIRPFSNAIDNPIRPFSNALQLFFVTLQLGLSYDFGFFNKKGVVAKTISISMASIAMISLGCHSIMTAEKFTFKPWLFFVCAQYILTVLRLFFNDGDKTFCVFLKRLSTIDYEMKNRIKYTDRKILGYCVIFMFYKSFASYMHCNFIPDDCVRQCLLSLIVRVISSSTDVHLILYSLSFHLVLCRMKVLRNFLRDSNEPISGQVFYKSLVDILEKCMACFDMLYLCSLIFKVFGALITTYTIIRYTKFQEVSYTSILVYSNWVFQYLLIVIVPAVIASRLAREMDKIKIILHDKLLLENATGSKALAIKNFLLYIEARPMRFHICSVIPLNSSLPFLVINAYVTNLIVILQLSHIY